ncbi:hypothetical protein C8R44DRAFT_732660 [Mycena epipterygia]|nr:hypothetical protein C8R44DRAFT_732660 [Mycena epipterygia]
MSTKGAEAADERQTLLPGVARLGLDLLSDMMLRASSIEEKFALAQVSRLWRDLALHTPLLWSSFTGGGTRADCSRVPLMLQRSGSTIMLHINFRFTSGATKWPADALKALVPYVARIETLDVEFTVVVPITPLLDSNLEFPALQTLSSRARRCILVIPLRRYSLLDYGTLDIIYFHSTNWATLFVPSLENIRLSFANDTNLGTLSDIFARCPLAWRVVLRCYDKWHPTPDDNRYNFTVPPCRSLAAALRELELQLGEHELKRVLNIGLADVILPTVTACISHLHKSVREIRILAWYWHDYVEAFEAYPPQPHHGFTLAVHGPFPAVDPAQPGGIMRLSGLANVEFSSDYIHDRSIQSILACIEPPTGRIVEVCIGNMKLDLPALQTALAEPWAVCSHWHYRIIWTIRWLANMIAGVIFVPDYGNGRAAQSDGNVEAAEIETEESRDTGDRIAVGRLHAGAALQGGTRSNSQSEWCGAVELRQGRAGKRRGRGNCIEFVLFGLLRATGKELQVRRSVE